MATAATSASSTAHSTLSSASAPHTATSVNTATTSPTHKTFNEALFLSSLNTTKPTHPPFTFRRTFLSPPLPKRTADGATTTDDSNDKNDTTGATVDVLRFGRHHPRRAELQGEWEEELIAQLQREEESKENAQTRQGEEDEEKREGTDGRGDKEERSPIANNQSSSSGASLTATGTAAPVSILSSSSSSHTALFSAPTTPLSAADASLSSVLHLLAADNQPTLPNRICNLLTAAISFHATLMQQFTSHVLQPKHDTNSSASRAQASIIDSACLTTASSSSSPLVAGETSVAVKHEEERLSTLPHFAAKFSSELTSSVARLKEAEALLSEWKKTSSLSTSDLTACDSLLTHVLHPLSTTYTSLLSPNPSLSAVASPSSLVASFLLAKRGRGRLHKCDKHRRWKKKCPPDCPDKPQGKWDDATAMDEDDEDDDEADEEVAGADEESKMKRSSEAAVAAEQSSANVSVGSERKRKADVMDSRDSKDDTQSSAVRVQPIAKRADVVKAVHAFQPIATATAITAASPPAAAATAVSLSSGTSAASVNSDDVVRARETALAASVIPSAMAVTSGSPMPHTAQLMAHPVAARPATLPATQPQSVFAAQPLMLQSALPSRPLPTNAVYTFTANQLPTTVSSASFAPPTHATHPTHTHTHTLVTLEQLTAMQQQGNTFHIVQTSSSNPPLPQHAQLTQAQPQQQPQHNPPTYAAHPYNTMSVVYGSAGLPGGGMSVGASSGQSGQQYTYTGMPLAGYQLV